MYMFEELEGNAAKSFFQIIMGVIFGVKKWLKIH